MKWLRKEEINKTRGIKYCCTFSSFLNLDRQFFDRYYSVRRVLIVTSSQIVISSRAISSIALDQNIQYAHSYLPLGTKTQLFLPE